MGPVSRNVAASKIRIDQLKLQCANHVEVNKLKCCLSFDQIFLRKIDALLLSSLDLQQNNLYIWNGHIAPWILIFACFGVFFGFRQINQTSLKQK